MGFFSQNNNTKTGAILGANGSGTQTNAFSTEAPSWGFDNMPSSPHASYDSFSGSNGLIHDPSNGANNFNMGDFLGEKGLGLGGMVQGILNGGFFKGAPTNNFALSGAHAGNTANSGYLGGGNSMGLNGENPTAGAGPWSDDAGSYGTGDGQTWHTDDYNWNGDSGGSDSSSGGYDSFSGDDATDGGYDAGWGDDGTGDDSGEY